MRRFLTVSGLTIIVFWFAGIHAAGQSSAVVVRDAQIKAGPAFGARTAGRAAAGDRITLGTRLGGWQKVTLLPQRNVEGWLRVYQFRTDIENPEVIVKGDNAEQGGALSGLAAVSRRSTTLFGRREMDSADGGMTAAIGIRGLSETDLENARPDIAQLKRLKKTAVNKREAKRYAEQSGLNKTKVGMLPAPDEDDS